MGKIKGILFDLGDTLIVEIDGPANVDTTEFDVLDGATDVLNDLRKSFKLAIVSNTFSWGDKDVARALERKDIARYFDAIVTSVDAGSRKPEAGIFEKAIRMLGCDAKEAIMVGDRVDTDIAGANRIGVTSILCRWNERYPAVVNEDEDLPDYIIGSIRELPALIKSLNK